MKARFGWSVWGRLRRGDEARGETEYVLCFASLIFCGHPFSLLWLRVPSLLHFSSHSSAPGLYRMQTEEASGIKVLFAFRSSLDLSFAHRLGVPTLRRLAMTFGRLDYIRAVQYFHGLFRWHYRVCSQEKLT